MIVLTKAFVPYQPFDLDIILNVTAAIYNLNLADFNCSIYRPPASNEAVLDILIFASVWSTKMVNLGHCALHGVTTSPIGI